MRWREWRRTYGARAREPVSRTAPRRAARATVALTLLLPQLTGCFQYVQTGQTVLPVGTEVSVGITDRGRAELAERVGPGVRSFGGTIVQSTDTALALSVQTVEYLDLGVQVRWAGERLDLPREFIAEVRERRFSRGRTLLAMGLAVAGVVVASLVAIAVDGGGEPGPGRPPNDNEPD